MSRVVGTDSVTFKDIDGGVFCAMPFGINPNGVATGKYLVMRYRVTSTTATDIFVKYTNAGAIAGIPVNNNGEWHTVIIELQSDFTDGDIRLMMYHPNGTTTWANGDTFELDWVKMFDSYDRIPGAQ